MEIILQFPVFTFENVLLSANVSLSIDNSCPKNCNRLHPLITFTVDALHFISRAIHLWINHYLYDFKLIYHPNISSSFLQGCPRGVLGDYCLNYFSLHCKIPMAMLRTQKKNYDVSYVNEKHKWHITLLSV